MQFVQAKHYKKVSAPRKVELLVIHSAENQERPDGAERLAVFFTNPIGVKGPVTVSAHYNIDNNSSTQSVKENDIAYHAGPVNSYSIGIELCGKAGQTRDEWLDAFGVAMLDRAAKLAAEICARHDIPIRRLTAEDLANGERRGICGHVDVTKGLQWGTHWDPGPNFPWDFFMERVEVYSRLPASVEDQLVPVWCGGEIWLVCPVQYGPVSIGQAKQIVESIGCELPSPALVDAIWRDADLRLDVTKLVRSHDGTAATMDAVETHADHADRIGEQTEGKTGARIVAGTFKDVVIHNGKIGIYGWHKPDNTVIQPFFSGHALAWRDYSQGVRPVKRWRK